MVVWWCAWAKWSSADRIAIWMEMVCGMRMSNNGISHRCQSLSQQTRQRQRRASSAAKCNACKIVCSRKVEEKKKCIRGIRWAQLDKSNAFLSLVWMRDVDRALWKLHKLNRVAVVAAAAVASIPLLSWAADVRAQSARSNLFTIYYFNNSRVSAYSVDVECGRISCMDQNVAIA